MDGPVSNIDRSSLYKETEHIILKQIIIRFICNQVKKINNSYLLRW
jgi:hypothetical protein